MIDKLKAQFEKKPLETIVVCAFAVTAAAKLIDSVASANNTRTWAKEVDRRTAMGR